ncbi:MAG: cupin domain-containing protein [Promethearchaeia archaeon]
MESKKKEFYYGAKLNKNIIDVYLGEGFLESNESGRKISPGRGHEEIIYVREGKIKIKLDGKEEILESGELLYIPERKTAILTNLSEKRSYFLIAGGHTKLHKH